MIDALVYIPSFSNLVAYFNDEAPERLLLDEDGNMVTPPVIAGFSRTPAVINGDKVMAYARFRDEEADVWRGTPGVEVLSEALFEGVGTGAKVYQQVLDDPEALAKYESVYDRFVPEEDPETGDVVIVERVNFGVMAGA
ncbi:hypothetical protein [Vreelandella glaciei]|uniref:hypothetical protein n=1 Tax=Vreelandella glaciei TaxID=186761 RepID=UPI0030EDD69C|tara:strand:- start:25697 stop:26113 length:417 start_codon:yes stop_codon:yes gene_type:complete